MTSLLEYVQSEDFRRWLDACKYHQTWYTSQENGCTYFLRLRNDITNPFNVETMYPCPDLNRVLKK